MEAPHVPLAIGTFDPTLSAVVTADGEVRLTPCEARLLTFLAAHPGEHFNVATIQRRVWGHAGRVESRTAYVTLARLRAKIEADPAHPRHLVATRHLGYRFVPLAGEEEDAEAIRLVRRLEALGYRVALSAARAAS